MPDQQPLTVEEWQAFLTEFSRRVLTSPEQTVDQFDPATELGFVTVSRFTPEVLEKGWLGTDPCRESDIAAAEARLGRPLPLRFRNFYLVSNGWTDAGQYGEDVWPIEKIDWLRNADPELLDAWLEVYDDEEAAILETSLLIGYADGGAGDYWLLKPPSVDADSEWTAYQWGPGSAGDPEPYENFAVLMSEYFDEVVAEG